jgi:hypothetical protein
MIPAEFLPRLVAEIPWGHNLLILNKLTDPAARLYYLQATAHFGWSRNVLLNQIKAGAYERARKEKKTHNFPLALPEYLAEQADEMLKSSYNPIALRQSSWPTTTPVADSNHRRATLRSPRSLRLPARLLGSICSITSFSIEVISSVFWKREFSERRQMNDYKPGFDLVPHRCLERAGKDVATPWLFVL